MEIVCLLCCFTKIKQKTQKNQTIYRDTYSIAIYCIFATVLIRQILSNTHHYWLIWPDIKTVNTADVTSAVRKEKYILK